MRVISLIQGAKLTSFPSCKDRHAYSERALSNSNCRKEKRDGPVFHRHSVHPATEFSGKNSGPLNNEINSRPGSQYRLRDEAANDKHDEGVERGVVASVFMRR